MRPVDKFRDSFRIFRILAKVVGQNIFQPDYKKTLNYYIFLAIWTFGIICYLTTAFDSYYDVDKRFFCLSMFSGAFQVK